MLVGLRIWGWRIVILQIRAQKSFQQSRNPLKAVKRNGDEDQIIEHLADSLAEKFARLEIGLL